MPRTEHLRTTYIRADIIARLFPAGLIRVSHIRAGELLRELLPPLAHEVSIFPQSEEMQAENHKQERKNPREISVAVLSNDTLCVRLAGGPNEPER